MHGRYTQPLTLVPAHEWRQVERILEKWARSLHNYQDWLRQRDAQQLARISKRSLIEARIAGRIQAIRLGDNRSVWLYYAPDCIAYRKRHRHPPGPASVVNAAPEAGFVADSLVGDPRRLSMIDDELEPVVIRDNDWQ